MVSTEVTKYELERRCFVSAWNRNSISITRQNCFGKECWVMSYVCPPWLLFKLFTPTYLWCVRKPPNACFIYTLYLGNYMVLHSGCFLSAGTLDSGKFRRCWEQSWVPPWSRDRIPYHEKGVYTTQQKRIRILSANTRSCVFYLFLSHQWNWMDWWDLFWVVGRIPGGWWVWFRGERIIRYSNSIRIVETE